MLNLLTIIGARPQIIKAAAISRAVRTCFADKVKEFILHTGQHYDANMSDVFFAEMGIPRPDFNLHVGSGTHAVQTANMLEGIEHTLQQQKFDGVILYGDTNSTLAGTLAASKLGVPIFHIEAGLRSYNMNMPEEINRIVCDQLSSILFAPTQTAIDNLKKEGIVDNSMQFCDKRWRKVVKSGDVMYDNNRYFSTIASQQSDVLERYQLENNGFVLATIHRDNNTDDPIRLTNIFEALLQLADKGEKIVLPLHPRTEKLLSEKLYSELYGKILSNKNLRIIPPASFFDMMLLEKHSKLVITDSGGVQKEAFFFEKPCIICRNETEWTEIIDAGAGILVDADKERILAAFEQLNKCPVHFPELFGDGHAAEKIVKQIIDYLQ